MISEVLHTKWGKARISDTGYYKITSSKEGNHNKKLHRLIYEDFWGVKLPEEISIHHIDGNKLNNCILNLESMYKSDHHKLHNKGVKRTDEEKLKISQGKSKSKYFRVSVHPCNRCKKGYVWKYRYTDEHKKRIAIYGATIKELKEKVLDKKLEWIELNGVES